MASDDRSDSPDDGDEFPRRRSLGSANINPASRERYTDFYEDVEERARNHILWKEREERERQTANRRKTFKAILWGAGGLISASALPQGWLPAAWQTVRALLWPVIPPPH